MASIPSPKHTSDQLSVPWLISVFVSAGYDDEALAAIVDHWKATPTTPGSMGDRAKQDAFEEWERRQAGRRHPAGHDSDPAV